MLDSRENDLSISFPIEETINKGSTLFLKPKNAPILDPQANNHKQKKKLLKKKYKLSPPNPHPEDQELKPQKISKCANYP